MNATAMLSRMFDRWYRRQIARRQLLDQVRFAGHRVGASERSRRGVERLHVADTERPAGTGSRRNG